MANNSAPSYKLVLSGEQHQQLKTWAERAAAVGKTAEYVAVLKTIHQKLTAEPLVWGDPWFYLHQLGLHVYQRAYTLLHVSYAVDEERRIVHAIKFTLLSGGGIGEGE